MSIVSKIERSNKHLTFILRINTIGILRIAITYTLAIITAKTKTKARYRVVIDTQSYTILISNFELKRIGSTLLNPVYIGKVIGIKTCQQLCLVAE